MESTSDNLGDYRARAAACRAMAEKAAEFPSEARTWTQIAEMWEGLADRAEGKPAAAGPTPTAAPLSGDDGKADSAGLTDRQSDPGVPGSEDGMNPPVRGPMRRAAVVAGFLLLPVLAVAAFWPAGKRATTVAEQSVAPPAQPDPQPVASKAPNAPAPASQPRITQAIAAPPPPAPVPEPALPVQPAPERVAEAPAPAAPAEPLSETGSVGQRQAPEPDAPAAEPPGTAPPGQKLAALPNAQRLSTRGSEPAGETAAPREKLTGIWWPTTCPKPAERKNAVRMVLADNRAQAGSATCTFLKKTQAGTAWTVLAKCSDGKTSWTAHIRLVLEGKRLEWASERGTQTYHRCG